MRVFSVLGTVALLVCLSVPPLVCEASDFVDFSWLGNYGSNTNNFSQYFYAEASDFGDGVLFTLMSTFPYSSSNASKIQSGTFYVVATDEYLFQGWSTGVGVSPASGPPANFKVPGTGGTNGIKTDDGFQWQFSLYYAGDSTWADFENLFTGENPTSQFQILFHAQSITGNSSGIKMGFDKFRNDGDLGENPPVVPEPATLLMLGLGLATLPFVRRRLR